MGKIDVIENEIYDCQKKIEQFRSEIKRLLPELEDAYLEHKNLVRGKTVVTAGREKYIVQGVYCTENGVAFRSDWLTGYRIKKDGTPGSRLTTIYKGWVIDK